jgi:hypothetical protein
VSKCIAFPTLSSEEQHDENQVLNVLYLT